MTIDPSLVGRPGAPYQASWTSMTALLYALGVGAGVGELAFTTENSEGIVQRVLPTFAVVIGASLDRLPDVGTYDLAQLVHGEQRVTLHREIPVEGQATLQSTVVGIYDKGTAAIVASETTARDADDGTPLFTTYTSSFIRGEGGFGGERGPSGPRHVLPTTPPDFTVRYQTSADQALLYRLSGDRNRLHSDPVFAARGGFRSPILHGLCTYGFTGRALLHTLCDSDPALFRSMEARFSAPVYPGDTLVVSIWRTEEGQALFRTATDDGTVVIDQGAFGYGVR